MKRFLFAVLAATSLCASPFAIAQSYPSKLIRIIVPFPAGGTADILARLIGQQLSEAVGQPVVIDNRPGGNSIIGTEALARSPADGHTMGMLISTHTVNPYVAKSLPYDTIKDFTPIHMVAVIPGLLVVNPALPAKTVPELISLAKAKPGTLAYGQPGGLSSGHLAMELFKSMAGIDIISVPYKGAGPAMTDLMADQVQMVISSPGSSLPSVRAGRARAMATTGATRSKTFPDIPTFAESGLPGFELYEWYGLFFPAKTPPAIVAKMHKEIGRILVSPSVAQKLAEIGAQTNTDTPEEFSRFVQAEHARWGELIKRLKLKLRIASSGFAQTRCMRGVPPLSASAHDRVFLQVVSPETSAPDDSSPESRKRRKNVCEPRALYQI